MAFLGEGQGGLASLWYEVGLLERLLYKNKNQHRHTVHFQRLQQVHRILSIVRNSSEARGLLQELVSGKTAPTLPGARIAVSDVRNVRSSIGLSGLLKQLLAAIEAASKALGALLAQSFFMPFALTVLACLARIHSISSQAAERLGKSYGQAFVARTGGVKPTREAGSPTLSRAQASMDHFGTPGPPLRLSQQPGLAPSEDACMPPVSRQQVSGPVLPAGPQPAPAENAEDCHIGGVREGAKVGLGSPLAKRARLSNGVRGVMDPSPVTSPLGRLAGEIGERSVREAEGSDPVSKKVKLETTMIKDQVKQSAAGIDEARRKKKRAAAWLEELGFEGLEQKVESPQRGPFVPGKSTGVIKQGARKDEVTDAGLPFDLLAGTDFERLEQKMEV